MSKGRDRLSRLTKNIEEIRTRGVLGGQVVEECKVLFQDMLRTAHDLRLQAEDPQELEAAEYFEEMALLLERLARDLMGYRFEDTEESLGELERCLLQVESMLGP
ncbi:MAG: hypothetical protein KF760_08990 [Candidatus Eremiobacteraeota bacterium]|nr:hypothetical protein [Candidatus Eremiobacteraeota bacterium]MCW5869285.1 hypothetical protein [Candidatus Eremiobacteraeota bacterium]